MNPVARLLVGAGLALLVAGLLWQVAGRHLPLGRLPGDIAIERPNMKFYFPLATCLLLSLFLTGVVALWRFFK